MGFQQVATCAGAIHESEAKVGTDPILSGRSNVRHIRNILPVLYHPKYMDMSTKAPANEIVFATGNANKLKEASFLLSCFFCASKILDMTQSCITSHDCATQISICVGPWLCKLLTHELWSFLLNAASLRSHYVWQVVAILEAGRPLPFQVKAANLDLPELQGEPEEIAKEKCRLAADQVNFAELAFNPCFN